MLHPFFSYFGSKYRLAKHYPPPEHEKIIEPFAGSAGYSLLYPEKKVLLYEIYQPIIELWDYLINVSEEEILNLPLGPFSKENPVSEQKIPDPAKTLLGFWLTESQTSASRYPLSKSRGGNWTQRKKEKIASQLKYIRHWNIHRASFEEIPNREATWFVDPPYQQAGSRYKFNNIDYDALSEWCKTRRGQTIVCEQNDAKWLNFDKRLVMRNASNKSYYEVYCLINN